MFDRVLLWIAGSKYHYVLIAGIIMLLLVTIVIGVGSCGRRDTSQIEQSAASAEAANSAGAAAVNTAASVAADEIAADARTRQTIKEIDNAQTPDAVRSAVLDRLCGQETHLLDPACRVRRAGAR
jgi:hypothetical protein